MCLKTSLTLNLVLFQPLFAFQYHRLDMLFDCVLNRTETVIYYFHQVSHVIVVYFLVLDYQLEVVIWRHPADYDREVKVWLED